MIEFSPAIEELKAALAGASEPRRQFDLLTALAWHLGLRHPVEAVRQVEQALQLARDHEADDWPTQRCLAVLGLNQRLHCNNEQAISLFDRAEDEALRNEDWRCRTMILNERAQLALTENDFERALQLLDSSADLIRRAGEYPYGCRMIEATVYSRRGMFVRALEIHLEIAEWGRDIDNIEIEAICYHNIANIHLDILDYNNCRAWQKRALSLFRRKANRVCEVLSLAQLADIERRQRRCEQARILYLETLRLLRKYGLDSYEQAHLINLAAMHYQLKEYSEARRRLERSASLGLQSGEEEKLAQVFLLLGMVDMAENKPSDALRHLQQARAYGEGAQADHFLWQIHRELYNYHRRYGGADEELRHFKQYSELCQRVLGFKVQQQVATLLSMYAQRLQASEHQLLVRRQDELQRELQRKDEELAALARHQIQLRESLLQLRREVQDCFQDKRESERQLLESLLAEVGRQEEMSRGWQEFESQFEAVHQDFQERLSAAAPTLLPAERKVCALLRVNLSSKEVAAMLQISIATVNTHRQRIRKKMGLTAGENLVAELLRR